MASATDIANRALLGIGARAQISSISPSDGSTEADAIATLFTPTFEALARSAHWNCLRKQVPLTVLAAAAGTPENQTGTLFAIPPVPWLYSYAYPSDCLDLRFLVPSLPSQVGQVPSTTYNNSAQTCVPGVEQIPYVVSYAQDSNGAPLQILLTNQMQAQAVYTVNQPNPIIWDSLFQAAMVASLGAYLVPALSMNASLMSAAVQNAERLIAKARIADGNEGVTVMDHMPDWFQARSGAVVGLAWGQGLGGTSYQAMPWPGG